MPDPVAAVGAPPATVSPAQRPPADGFAQVLAASRRDVEALETVTLGEMLHLATHPATAALPTAAAAPVGATAATTGGLAWPVRGRATSEFGPRVHPVTGAHRDHLGLDIAAPTGTPITAAAAGTVTFAGPRGGYGNVVIIDHGGGLETRYAHQHTIAVTAGQTVGARERIGTVGSTGLSTGPHLHFEVRRGGTAVDPRRLLAG